MKIKPKLFFYLFVASGLLGSVEEIKPSRAILESNVGEMEVELSLIHI